MPWHPGTSGSDSPGMLPASSKEKAEALQRSSIDHTIIDRNRWLEKVFFLASTRVIYTKVLTARPLENREFQFVYLLTFSSRYHTVYNITKGFKNFKLAVRLPDERSFLKPRLCHKWSWFINYIELVITLESLGVPCLMNIFTNVFYECFLRSFLRSFSQFFLTNFLDKFFDRFFEKFFWWTLFWQIFLMNFFTIIFEKIFDKVFDELF
jgi:hypothetical protein